MANPNSDTTIVDGSIAFEGGVDSLKVTTVASPRNPNGLARNQAAWLNNMTVRDGGITIRDGWEIKGKVHNSNGIFQGGFLYQPTNGTDPYIMASISGHIWKIPVDSATPIDLSTSPALTNPSGDLQAYFVQGEEFLVIQAGDYVTLPLFWDGTILRRSAGLAPTSGLVLIGSIQFNGKLVPETGGPIGLDFGFPPPLVVGDSLTIIQNGTTNSLGNYQVYSIGGNEADATRVDFNARGSFSSVKVNVYKVVAASTAELPAAGPMDYYLGHIWYAQGKIYTAGDTVRNQASGTLAYNFRDSILKVTENPLAIGGDGFAVSGASGNITALKHPTTLNTPLGQGQLLAFTRKEITALSVPVSRNDWIAANANNQPQQVVALPSGAVNDRCVVSINGDLFFQTMEPAIQSFVFATRYFNEWGNVPVSSNEHRILQFNDRSLMNRSSGIVFANRLLETALPKQLPQGIVHQALIPLDFTAISSFGATEQPTWEGMYEGLDHLQLFVGDSGGRDRAFSLVVSRTDSSIELWELTDHLTHDINNFGEARITGIIEFPAYTTGNEFLLKKLVSGELWVDRIQGTVNFTLEYRPDGDSCWHLWHKWQVCSARNSCEDVLNPICYPLQPFGPGYRQTMTLPRPPDDCNAVTARPMNVGCQFQPRLTVHGYCRIRGILLEMEKVERRLNDSPVC